MDGKQRKALLIESGLTQRAIARALKCSDANVSLIVSGKGQSRRVQRYISRKVGIPERELFPEAA